MTVEVPSKPFLCLLFKWKGSIWKSVWKHLLVYMLLYTLLNCIYRFALNDEQKADFEDVISVIQSWKDVIPLQFILGFFVAFVIGQWWAMLTYLPWPDEFLFTVNTYIKGQDKESVKVRRTLARWSVLHCILTYQNLCEKVKRRFPKDIHLLKNGLMTDEEHKLYRSTTPDHGRSFVPIWWSANLLSDLHDDDKITDFGLQETSKSLWRFYGCSAWLALYSWIRAPLRYIQIATFAVYGYFAIHLITSQVVKQVTTSGRVVDLYAPLVLIIEFIFYVGWLKVAEENMFPLGMEDDDFSINYIMDRIHMVSFMFVDELHAQRPKPTKDMFAEDEKPRLRHTVASYKYRDHLPPALLDPKLKDEEVKVYPAFDHFKDPQPEHADDPNGSPERIRRRDNRKRGSHSVHPA